MSRQWVRALLGRYWVRVTLAGIGFLAACAAALGLALAAAACLHHLGPATI